MGTKLIPDGAKIKALRIQRGWTQEQLAEIAGVSSRTIQRAETAGCAAFETLRAIASAFETGFDQLLEAQARGGPELEIVQLAPEPAHIVKMDEPNANGQSANPGRLKLATYQVAAAALAAGILAGVIFTYRYDRSYLPAPQLSSVVPAQTGVWHKAPQFETAPGQDSALLTTVPQPVAQAATRDRKAMVPAEMPEAYASAAPVGEIFQPSNLPPRTVITSLPPPAYCDLPLQPRGLFVDMPEVPLTWTARSTFPGSLKQDDEGLGAVRQATGQATKKTGEFVTKAAASTKRAF